MGARSERLLGLDGLRAFAVLAVFLFHYEQPHISGGLLGVQTFFVLSGWLITGILAKEHARAGRISYRRFMSRRFLRLVPALVVVTIGCVIAAVASGSTAQIGWWAPGAMLYVNNLLIPLNHPSTYLSPTWSLAVEMQFYVVSPFVLAVLLRRGQKAASRVFAGCAVTMMVAIAVLALILPLQWLYFPGLGGVCGLLAGSALALRPMRVRPVLGVGAFAVLLGACFVSPDWTHKAFWLGWVQLSTLASMIVVAWLSSSPGGAFSSRPAVWIGQRSYAIYLYHVAVRVVLLSIVSLSASRVTLIGLVITLALAALSYRLVELPFLRIKRRYEAPISPEPDVEPAVA